MANHWRVDAWWNYDGADGDLLGAVLYWPLGLEFTDMTQDEALKLALETLESSRVFVMSREKIKQPEGANWYDNRITAIKEALAQPAQEPQVCCGEYDTCLRACTPRGRYLAQPEERNFCPRCGKRTADLTTIHTCTPPIAADS